MTPQEVAMYIEGFVIALFIADKVVAKTDNKYDDIIVTAAKNIFNKFKSITGKSV